MAYRVLDANRNRAREGLRVLEDVARFQLDDGALAENLRLLRQELSQVLAPLEDTLLSARRAAEDVGASFAGEAEGDRPDTLAIVAANAKRAEEALRTLEEFSKLPEAGIPAGAQVFKRLRFGVYELEGELRGRLLRQERREGLRGLYVIVDPEQCRGRAPVEVAQAALAGGAAVVQLRDKVSDKGRQFGLADQLKELCHQAGAIFIVNDHADLAAAVGADGVHLGQDDLPLGAARRLLPLSMLVGASTHDVEQAQRAVEQGADYVAVGAMFETATKGAAVPAGIATLRQIKKAVGVPVVAIGGITQERMAAIAATGADMAAVISAVCGAEDAAAATRALAAAFTENQPP